MNLWNRLPEKPLSYLSTSKMHAAHQRILWAVFRTRNNILSLMDIIPTESCGKLTG